MMPIVVRTGTLRKNPAISSRMPRTIMTPP
jgi:hypothetical protein